MPTQGKSFFEQLKMFEFSRFFFFLGLRTGVLLGVIYDIHRVHNKPETNLGRWEAAMTLGVTEMPIFFLALLALTVKKLLA